MIKLNFQNAFNAIRRDCILDSVSLHIPEILPYVLASYGAPSKLVFGSYNLSSSEGVQPGDPLGPFLFSLAISEALSHSSCTFTVGYLDDVTLGDTVQSLGCEIFKLRSLTAALGLSLNEAKCEIVGLSDESRQV